MPKVKLEMVIDNEKFIAELKEEGVMMLTGFTSAIGLFIVGNAGEYEIQMAKDALSGAGVEKIKVSKGDE
jgi:hypothetical protein